MRRYDWRLAGSGGTGEMGSLGERSARSKMIYDQGQATRVCEGTLPAVPDRCHDRQ